MNSRLDALNLLGLDLDTDFKSIEIAIKSRSDFINERLKNAPTDGLKRKYEAQLAELNEAAKLLLAYFDETDLPSSEPSYEFDEKYNQTENIVQDKNNTNSNLNDPKTKIKRKSDVNLYMVIFGLFILIILGIYKLFNKNEPTFPDSTSNHEQIHDDPISNMDTPHLETFENKENSSENRTEIISIYNSHIQTLNNIQDTNVNKENFHTIVKDLLEKSQANQDKINELEQKELSYEGNQVGYDIEIIAVLNSTRKFVNSDCDFYNTLILKNTTELAKKVRNHLISQVCN